VSKNNCKRMMRKVYVDGSCKKREMRLTRVIKAMSG
jgi:hypothetical protein